MLVMCPFTVKGRTRLEAIRVPTHGDSQSIRIGIVPSLYTLCITKTEDVGKVGEGGVYVCGGG
jgi:hypothetical protein